MTSRVGGGPLSYSYGYDATGRRVHTVFSVQGQTQFNSFFIYDGSKLLGEVTSTGGVTASYTWGADGLVSEHLSPVSGTAKSLWYLFGPQGETRQLTSSTGQQFAPDYEDKQ